MWGTGRPREGGGCDWRVVGFSGHASCVFWGLAGTDSPATNDDIRICEGLGVVVVGWLVCGVLFENYTVDASI